MSSTSESNLILQVKDLSLGFRRSLVETSSWRDSFTKLFQNRRKNRENMITIADKINFSLKSGERLGLVGVNGAGKTSLCRCLAGIYQPTSGTVVVNGRLRALFNTQAGIQPELTAVENGCLLSEFLYPGEPNKHQIVEEALRFADLGKWSASPYHTFSHGMQTRFWLSLVSSRPADLLILDEVFEGADVFFRKKIETRFLNLIQQSGAAVFVSHSREQILKVCNRVIVLESGHLVFDGAPAEAMSFYENGHKASG